MVINIPFKYIAHDHAQRGDLKLAPYSVIEEDVILGEGVFIGSYCNIYGCEVGDYTKIAIGVEIRRGAKVGSRCKIEPYVFIPEGIEIEDEVFVGAGTVFTNDRLPRATTPDGDLKGPEDWKMEEAYVKRGASIGARSVIGPGVTIGEYSLVGMGSVVIDDVPPYTFVAGVPAKVIRDVDNKEEIIKALKERGLLE
ncbi:MAG: acyltransferase [Candidatus Aenigmatarchaeota archaeon]